MKLIMIHCTQTDCADLEHRVTERPYLFDNPKNDIYYINQNTVKHEH